MVCGVLLKAVVLKVGSPDPQGSVGHCQGVREEFATKYVKKNQLFNIYIYFLILFLLYLINQKVDVALVTLCSTVLLHLNVHTHTL